MFKFLQHVKLLSFEKPEWENLLVKLRRKWDTNVTTIHWDVTVETRSI